MKKLLCLFLSIAIYMSMFISMSVHADMTESQITLYGDDAFKAEILTPTNDTIASNSIFVSPTGNDTNNGSINSPFATVQKALNEVQAGQTIYLREGTYTANNTFVSSGEEGKYITLRNYPNENAFLTSNTSGAIIATDGNSYLKIVGLEIGNLSSDKAYGILADGDEDHIIIRNNNIHNLVTTKPGENQDGEANAILFYGEGKTEELSINNICIQNNYVHDNVTGWCESVSVTGNAKYINIINNKVENNTNIGIDFYGNAGYCSVKELDQPRYCVAAGNTVSGSICGYAECAGLYVDGARDVVLENNKLFGNMYGIEIGSEEGHTTTYDVKNIIARNNVVYNNSAGGIRVGGYDKKTTGYVKDTKIYNNTLVNNGEGEGGWNGELCFVKCDGIDVRNNIVYKDNKDYPLIGGDLDAQYVLNVTFANNMYYSPLGAEGIYFEYTGKGAEGIDAFNAQTGGNDIFGKPTFNSDYSLAKGSMGIDLGSSIVAEYVGKYDFAGNNRIDGVIDIGAFEYQTGSAPSIETTESTTQNVESSTETTTKIVESSTETTTKAPVSTTGNFKKHNFTTEGKTDNYFTISGNLSTSKGSTTFNGLNLTQCLKIESSTSIKFTNTEKGTLTLVFVGTTNIKIDGVKKTGTNGILTIDLEPGTHTLTKADTANLFYMSFVEKALPGDINCNGVVDGTDAALAIRDMVNLERLETELVAIGDNNNSGAIEITDVIWILKNKTV